MTIEVESEQNEDDHDDSSYGFHELQYPSSDSADDVDLGAADSENEGDDQLNNLISGDYVIVQLNGQKMCFIMKLGLTNQQTMMRMLKLLIWKENQENMMTMNKDLLFQNHLSHIQCHRGTLLRNCLIQLSLVKRNVLVDRSHFDLVDGLQYGVIVVLFPQITIGTRL